MNDWQRNQRVATIRQPAEGRLDVYVARWPGYPAGPRDPLVMWLDGSNYRYLSPQDARRFAQALILAAVEAEGGEQP
jgi:hypothetical protein